MSKRKFGSSINGKGYYIALILCAVAIGISGYLYYSHQNSGEPQGGNPDVSAVATNPGDDVAAVATQPGTEGTEGTDPTQPSVSVKPKPMQTVTPVEGQTVAVYAMDSLTYNPTTRDWRVHNGVDIAAEEGTKVVSAADGTVYTVYSDETMGTTVVISHDDGYTTKYACLAEEVSVKAGEKVKAGQQIGCVGQTALLESAIGHHVHFSVSRNDEPVDPAEFLALD
jgi:murein DD-endopeptidase MepM/ murein hydrolase activator NlpD